jgi:hypothetical protein
MKGLIKSIGPGDSINIWSDNWTPGLGTLKPMIRLPCAQVEKVSDFFVPGTRICNDQLVRTSFCAFEAEEVLKLRPGIRMDEHVLSWAFEKNGLFSVRSCYRLLKHE